MKRILIFLPLCFVLSCNFSNQKQAQQVEKLRQDSLTLVKLKRFDDSVAVVKLQREAEILELSKIAFAETKFGMTTKEVLKTDIFKEDTYYGNGIISKSSENKLGNYLYQIGAHFNNDSLWLILISSKSQTANYIDTDLLSSLNNLKDVIAEKYGEPDIINDAPDIFDFKPGFDYNMYRWKVGNKAIKIGMYELSSGSEYKVMCSIYYKPIYERLLNNNIETNRKQVKSDASKF